MNKFLACLSLLLASIFSSHTTASNDLVPIESFSKDIEFAGVKISPDGKYLAVITRPEGKNVLMVLSTDTFKVSHAISFPNDALRSR